MDWQQIAVYLLVALAAWYLARRYLRPGRKSGGCGGCQGACGNPAPKAEETGPTLVQLEVEPPRRPASKRPG